MAANQRCAGKCLIDNFQNKIVCACKHLFIINFTDVKDVQHPFTNNKIYNTFYCESHISECFHGFLQNSCICSQSMVAVQSRFTKWS